MNTREYFARATNESTKSIWLNFEGFVVQFRSNSASLNRELAAYYRHFRISPTEADNCLVEGLQCPAPALSGDWEVKQPEPGKHRIKEHILHIGEGRVIRKVATGVHLFFVGSRRLCAGPLEDNPNQVVNFINNMYLEHLLTDRGQLFHAAGVCQDAFGIGMAGSSGKGKSTLALRLLQRGMDLVSNDRLVVYENSDGSLHMHGIPKYPRINPGTLINQPELRHLASHPDLARYEAMSDAELWDLEEKYDAFIEETFDARFRLGTSMRVFIALDWDRSLAEPTRLVPRNPAESPRLVETIMKSPGVMLPASSRRIPVAVIEPYIELLDKCRFYVLEGGVDFDAAADQILALPDSVPKPDATGS